jgi:acyl-CoA dehydrogenase
MAWDFETDPDFQEKLDWIDAFMKEEIDPLSALGMAGHGRRARDRLIRPLQQRVKEQGLWARHLAPRSGARALVRSSSLS